MEEKIRWYERDKTSSPEAVGGKNQPLVADLSLDKDILQEAYHIRLRRGCRLMIQSRCDDYAITQRIREIAETRIHILLRREGWLINNKKAYRIYYQEGLNRWTMR